MATIRHRLDVLAAVAKVGRVERVHLLAGAFST